jgi:hypothetical protein
MIQIRFAPEQKRLLEEAARWAIVVRLAPAGGSQGGARPMCRRQIALLLAALKEARRAGAQRQ